MAHEGTMTESERTAFLEGVHVAILAIDEPGRGPLALPIWYQLVEGSIELGMDGRSKKAELLRRAGRATLTVQEEQPPYRYVSVEGPVELVDKERDVLGVASRYLGPELGAWYAERNPATTNTVLAVLRPENWRTRDFSGATGDGRPSST